MRPTPPIGITKISTKAARRLLKSVGGKHTEEICPVLGEFRLNDGRVLIIDWESTSGILYDSAHLLQQILEPLRKANALEPKHCLEKRLPFGEEFPEKVPFLIAELSTHLGLDPQRLNFDPESFSAIDSALRKIGEADAVENPMLLGSLVAYLGEIYRRRVAGIWKMIRGADGKTWEPWIIDAAGRRYNPWRGFLDEDERVEYDPKGELGLFTFAIAGEVI